MSRLTRSLPLLVLCALIVAPYSTLLAQRTDLSAPPAAPGVHRVKVGAEVLLEKFLDSLKGKRVGVICNRSSILPDGTHLVDTLLRLGVNITALFGPEHGIRGNAAAGAVIGNETDSATGIPVYSLYGKVLKPSAEMLQNVDVLLFDLQDAGSRFFTYASTMANAMEAARDNSKRFMILDRPDPINGVDLEGPVLDMTLVSFFGMFPIPVRHGLTLGELARMIVGEGWLNFDSHVDLMVIPMQGWKRSMWYDETKLPWVPPSPNMKTLATATVYPGMCLFEATNISEGRGTGNPFEFIGAPGMRHKVIAAKLNALKLPGVYFQPVEFTPHGDSASGPNPKFNDKACRGIYVHVTDRKTYKPVLTGVLVLATIQKAYPHVFVLTAGRLDRLIGDTLISQSIDAKRVGLTVLDFTKRQIDQFKKVRSKYLLYR